LSEVEDKLVIKLMTASPAICRTPFILSQRICNYSFCRTNDAISWGNCTRRQMEAITGEYEWSAANL